MTFSAGAIQIICVCSDGFSSDNPLTLTILAVRQCMYIEVKLHMCGDFKLRRTLTLVVGVGFINISDAVAGVPH
jgi:hypothetical protein